MDGVHDLGGMHGFGAIPTGDDASFHADWERLVFGMDRILRSQGVIEIDEKRHAIERMPPGEYLQASYFERWLAALEILLEEHGIITGSEITDRAQAETTGTPSGPDDLAEVFRAAFEAPAAFDRAEQPPRFAVGDTVVVKNQHPSGHTRSPRYARGATGQIATVHGTFVLPDANAHGDDRAEPLYSVRFEPAELWGPDHEGPGGVRIDLWESYLDQP